jgi:putative PIN family toxin of toxin-antitoxin system
MIGVTADTNIYISALNFGGTPDKVLDLARRGEIRLSISDNIIDEIEQVLRSKFRWNEDAIKLAKERIGDFTEHVHPLEVVRVIKEDQTDNRILECAQVAKSDFIVSGDRHLLRLVEFAESKIVTAGDFLGMFEQQGRTR